MEYSVLVALALAAVALAAVHFGVGVTSGARVLARCVERDAPCATQEPAKLAAARFTPVPAPGDVDPRDAVGPLDSRDAEFFVAHTTGGTRPRVQYQRPEDVIAALSRLPKRPSAIGPHDVKIVEPTPTFLRQRRGKRVDLRPYATKIREQSTNTCMGFATAAAIELMLKQKTGKDYDLSDVQCNSSRKGAREHVVTEHVWPELNAKGPSDAVLRREAVVRVGPAAYSTKLADAITALDQKRPVVIQWAISRDPELKRTGLFPTRFDDPRYPPLSHGMTIVGYHVDPRVPGGGYLIIRNSWGTDWGDHGYAYMPFSMCLPSKGGTNGCGFIHYDRIQVLKPPPKPRRSL